MRIVAWDIETTDLKTMVGIVLCCSFKPIVDPRYTTLPLDPYTYSLEIDPNDPHQPDPDHTLVVAIRDELERNNTIVGWNSKMFDLPFVNSRLMFFGERPVNPQLHLDMMYFAGSIFNRIGSRKLVSVQQYLRLSNEKTVLDWEVWKRAARGDPAAMASVVDHCERDVRVLSEAYWHLLPFVRNIHR